MLVIRSLLRVERIRRAGTCREIVFASLLGNGGDVGVSSLEVSLSLHIDREFLTKIGIIGIVSVITP